MNLRVSGELTRLRPTLRPPERATDPVCGLASEWIGGIGVDASGADLGVAKDALYDVTR